MKRFYCVKCERLRRQRRWPANILYPDAPDPTKRFGTCDVCIMLAQRAAKISRSFRVWK